MVLAATNYPWQIDEALRRWVQAELRVGSCVIRSARRGHMCCSTHAGGIIARKHMRANLSSPTATHPSQSVPLLAPVKAAGEADLHWAAQL